MSRDTIVFILIALVLVVTFMLIAIEDQPYTDTSYGYDPTPIIEIRR